MLHALVEGRVIARRDVFGIAVTDFTRDEALQWVHGQIAVKNHTPITFLNAHNANVAMRDHGFRSALDKFTILSDGVGVDIAAKVLHGRRFRANLNGTDFVPALLATAHRPLKVALLGARPGVAEKAAARFAAIDARHEYRVVHHGYMSKDDEQRVLSHLEAWSPDILLVAMGVPKQEKWIAENITAAHCTVSMGIGALFDFASGSVARAPGWVRAMRSEWAFRLLQEPGRMWRRYLVGNPLFLGHVLRYKLSAWAR